jgi:hypothetical protein
MKMLADLEEQPEAVIISGRQRGQIIRLGALHVKPSESPNWDAELDALGHALDSLNRKLSSVSKEVRQASKALKSRLQAS